MTDSADFESLPPTHDVDADVGRPCDRCPSADGAVVFYHGREWCLCRDCYRRFLLDR